MESFSQPRFTESTPERLMKLSKQSSNQFLELRDMMERMAGNLEPLHQYFERGYQAADMSQKIGWVSRTLLGIPSTQKSKHQLMELCKVVVMMKDGADFHVLPGRAPDSVPRLYDVRIVFFKFTFREINFEAFGFLNHKTCCE